MVLQFVRVLFLLAVVAITASFAYQVEVYHEGPSYVTVYVLAPVLLAFALVMADLLWKRKRLQVLSGLFFGVLAGLVIAFMLSLIVDLAVSLFPTPPPAENPGPPPVSASASQPVSPLRLEEHQQAMDAYLTYMTHVRTVQLVKGLLSAAAVFLCVSFVLQTKDDFRFIIPYVEFAKQSKGARPLVLDTSVIIDGRIADVADTRILDSEVLVPRFILAELQAVADSEDKLRRNRGRRGLDVLSRLQSSSKIDIRILDSHIPELDRLEDVDAKLVALAKHLGGRIMTNDYNLNKVAQLRGVNVININEMASALRPVFLPGEPLTVKVIRPGEEPGQGVGYLEDGTMVVAEGGRDHIGRQIDLIVTSVLQTSAGRMIFGRMDSGGPSSRPENCS